MRRKTFGVMRKKDEKEMLEFLKDCIHELKDLVTQTVDHVYLKELEIIINKELKQVKTGVLEISYFRKRINSEIKHVYMLLHLLALEIKGISRGRKKPPEDEKINYIPETVLETLDGTYAQILSKLKSHKVKEESTPEEIKEIAPVYVYLLKERLLEEYLTFLEKVSKKIIKTIDDPEYWKSRSQDKPEEPKILDILEKAQRNYIKN